MADSLQSSLKIEIENYKNKLLVEKDKGDEAKEAFIKFNEEFHEKLRECQNFYDLVSTGQQFYNRQSTLVQSNVNAQRELENAQKTLERAIEEHHELDE
jgi:DNA-binding GntR family transcriptional regulator